MSQPREHNIMSRRHLYEILVRNSYFLPKFKSGLVNYDWLLAVRQGVVYCPKYSEIRIRQCFDPPTKEVLVKELLRIVRAKRPPLNIGIASETKGGLPDKGWVLFLISTFEPNHAFFAKTYTAPTRKREKDKSKLNNDDGLFTGLDHIQNKYEQRRGKN